MNPIHELQKKEEEKLDIASDILANARNELYFALRYLDTALSALHFQADPGCETLGTDGGFLYFNPDWLLNAFLNGKVRVNRLYLHEVLHCLFCHLWQGEKKTASAGIWPAIWRWSPFWMSCIFRRFTVDPALSGKSATGK